MNRNRLQGQVAAAADLLLRYGWKEWFWADSIGFEGLLDASRVTGDERYFGFVYGFLKAWAARMEARSRFDHTAPGLALVRCLSLTADPALLDAARSFAAYLDTFRRTAGGCPVHYEDVQFDLPPDLPIDHPDYKAPPESAASRQVGACVFVDSVHFHGPFLAALYSITGDNRYLEQAAATIGPQIDLLWDDRQDLFHHFWIERENRPCGVFWGRGNGWGLLGMLDTLQYLPSEHALAERMRGRVARLARRLTELQDPSGDWHTVLTDPDSYLESSVACFVVDGFTRAMANGWLSSDYQSVVDKAWRAVQSHIRVNGLFDDVSFETYPSTNAVHYRTMPTGAMVPWGQGPFLTACARYAAAHPGA